MLIIFSLRFDTLCQRTHEYISLYSSLWQSTSTREKKNHNFYIWLYLTPTTTTDPSLFSVTYRCHFGYFMQFLFLFYHINFMHFFFFIFFISVVDFSSFFGSKRRNRIIFERNIRMDSSIWNFWRQWTKVREEIKKLRLHLYDSQIQYDTFDNFPTCTSLAE